MTAGAFDPLLLPNGTWLKNRIAKAAMEEKLADVHRHNQPSSQLIRLYKTWGAGGAGLILSGHIMIDPYALACPGDLLLAEDARSLDEPRWRELIQETKRDGAQFWLQINHPGRQIRKGTGLPVYAPSAVKMQMGAFSNMFETPIAMAEDQIQDVIRRFAWTAKKAEELGADGVEIHGAHGYLISQFLSPLSNRRTDRWGGSRENRARLLFEVVQAVRAIVSDKFGVGVKINTADFQRGGFEVDDLFWVIEQLNKHNLDFVEISGGSFEAAVMATGVADTKSSSTAQREAYFLDVATQLKDITQLPVIVTGGISRRAVLDQVVHSSDRFIAGIGTALGLVPDLPKRWQRGEDPAPPVPRSWILLPQALTAIAKTSGVQLCLHLIGRGWSPWVDVWPALGLVWMWVVEAGQLRTYKRWIHQLEKLE